MNLSTPWKRKNRWRIVRMSLHLISAHLPFKFRHRLAKVLANPNQGIEVRGDTTIRPNDIWQGLLLVEDLNGKRKGKCDLTFPFLSSCVPISLINDRFDNPWMKGAFGQRSFSVNTDFLLQLPKCLSFGPPYRLSCYTPCITNFLRSPGVYDLTAAVSYLKRLVCHLDFVSVEA